MRSALAVLLCGTLVTVACGNEEPAGVAVPRHIVMITIDTLRADRLGSYGYDRELTPHLDRLADEGARFAQATAPITCTAPSHATLFTGQHPLAHGLTDNFHKLPGSVETLAETLSKRGFQTAAFFHQFQFSAAGVTQGFDTLTRDKTNDASTIVPAVRAWLQRADPAKRKFLWVHFFLPHAPSVRTPAGPCGRSFRTVSECAQLVRFGDRWIEHPYEGPLGQDFRTLEAIRKGDLKPPPEYFENFRDGYDSDVALTDVRIGGLLEVLRRADLLDTSLIVVAADHGESLERGVVGLHSPIIRQAVLHVPLIFWARGLAATVVDPVVSLVDVHPTILDLVRVEGPRGQGRSLLPLLRGNDENWDDRAYAMLPTRYLGKSVPGFPTDPAAMAVRTGNWKLVQRGRNPPELYDLHDDPLEERNVATDHPRVAASLQRSLDEWVGNLAQTRDSTEPLPPEVLEHLKQLGYVSGEDG